MPDFRRNAGFSLVELAIVVGLAGLFTASFSQQYRTWVEKKISGDTGSRMNIVSSAMTLFLTNYGRLPCPADPALPPTAATSGYEVCPANYGQDPPDTICSGQVCRVLGRRDANNGQSLPDPDNTDDPVLIGALPYAALGLSVKDVVDGWDHKMTYAVSEYLTRTATFNEQYGAIGFQETSYDSTGTVAAPVNSLGPFGIGSYMLAIVSHGADGKGAYNYQGGLITPCDATLATGRDNMNCDGDGVFLKASRTTGVYNSKPGPDFFDDAFTVFTIRRDSDKWVVTGSNGMQNKTSGKVGVGTASPQAELDVGGNILLEDFWANEYCSPSGNCFSPSMIAGMIDDANPSVSSAHCGTSATPQLMQGVNGAATWKLDCVNTVNTTGITVASCPSGQYMTGIDATGGITCATP